MLPLLRAWVLGSQVAGSVCLNEMLASCYHAAVRAPTCEFRGVGTSDSAGYAVGRVASGCG